MSSNMMEILKQIQRDLADQKEFMRIKFDVMERKIDQQQDTIQKLERQIKRNNGILFGNEETEIEVEDTTTTFDKPVSDNKEMEAHLVEQSEKCIDNFKVNQLQSELKVTKEDEKECNYKDENYENASSEHSNTVKVAKQDNKESNYESDNDKKDCKIVKYGECLANEMREIKDLIRDHITTRQASVEETASAMMCKLVNATQTNFSADQIKELNENLNKIAKKYEDPSKIVRIIELLYEGVSIPLKNKPILKDRYRIKLGMNGFKTSEVLSLLIEYPNLSITEVVRNWLHSTNQLNDMSETYDVYRVYDYNDFIL